MVLVCFVATAAQALDDWRAALARMPLGTSVGELNATNGIAVTLRALGSNATVKAMVFLPGATDEFYLVRRARALVTNSAPTLLDAVAALTNQTRIRATFRSPLLLLHTDSDRLVPNQKITHPATVERLRRTPFGQALSIDRDWDYVQPLLKWRLRLDVRPWEHSMDSWHFYRLNFSAWGLNGWEAMEIAALASKTGFTLNRNQAIFALDGDGGK